MKEPGTVSTVPLLSATALIAMCQKNLQAEAADCGFSKVKYMPHDTGKISLKLLDDYPFLTSQL